MNIEIVIDAKMLDWEDFEIIESARLAALRPVMARFLVDESGKTMPLDKAMDIIKRIPATEIAATVSKFRTAFNDSLLNPTSGDSSKMQSPAVDQPPFGGNSSLPQETGAVNPGS